MLEIVVLISGTGSLLRSLLEACEDASFPAKIVAVGADNDAPGLQHASKFEVDSFVVKPKEYADRAAWGDALLEKIRGYGIATENNPGLIVSAGFMRILPPNFVAEVSPFLINTHPALLPLFPGAHAVRDALAAGAKESGTTVHIVDDGVDTGPVLEQKRVPVFAGDTEETLHERIKEEERSLLVDVVKAIAENKISLKE